MKIVSIFIGMFLLNAPGFAADAETHLNQLKSALEGGVVNLSDTSRNSCADLSGQWVGQCFVTIKHNEEVLNATKEKKISIAQNGCQSISLDNKEMIFDVAINASQSSKQGFNHVQGAVYWMDDGQKLGFALEQQGMLFDENAAHAKLKKSGFLTLGKSPGTAKLIAEATLKSETRGEVDQTKFEYDCSLLLE